MNFNMDLINFHVGIDIVHIPRFKKLSYEKNKKFYHKCFNKDEIKYCLKFKDPSTHFAGKFAVKEATKKSVSIKLSFLEIITSHSQLKPTIKITNNKKHKFKVSISHDGDYAIAIVISEIIT